MAHKITRQECDAMMAGVINFAHGIEMFMRVVQEYYTQNALESKECKAVVNAKYTENLMKGMPRTLALRDAERQVEKSVRESTSEELNDKCPLPYLKLIAKVNELGDLVDEFKIVGIENSEPNGKNSAEIYDYIVEDGDIMNRVFCDFYDIDGRDHEAEQDIKKYKSKGIISDELVNEWFRLRTK